MVTTTSVRIARSSCLRSRNVVDGAFEDRPDVGAGPGQPGQLVLGELNGSAGLCGEQVSFGLPLLRQLGLQRPFQGAGDQSVLRLDRVVLSPGPVGFEPGPFHRQLERTQAGGVGLFGVGNACTVAASAAGSKTANTSSRTRFSSRRPPRL